MHALSTVRSGSAVCSNFEAGTTSEQSPVCAAASACSRFSRNTAVRSGDRGTSEPEYDGTTSKGLSPTSPCRETTCITSSTCWFPGSDVQPKISRETRCLNPNLPGRMNKRLPSQPEPTNRPRRLGKPRNFCCSGSAAAPCFSHVALQRHSAACRFVPYVRIMTAGVRAPAWNPRRCLSHYSGFGLGFAHILVLS